MKQTSTADQYVQKLKPKCIGIQAGKFIVIVHEKDAKELGINPLDRVELSCPKTKKKAVCVVDITVDSILKEDEIGLFEEVSEALKIPCDSGYLVEVRALPRPESVEYIKKKMSGQALSPAELQQIVEDLSDNKLSEIEAAAFMSAVYIHGFSLDEIVAMTNALTSNGKKMNFTQKFVVDKHSIGGINGRATMIIVPIVAALGLNMPKTSSRSITSAAGTADAMEVLAEVSLPMPKIEKIVSTVGGCVVWGGALDLAPVDDKIIKIEYPLALDPEGQVVASVMAKKACAGAKFLVIDIPVGPAMKISSTEKGQRMAQTFIEVGKRLGIKVEVVLTDGVQPSGDNFGPALEAREVLEILEGKKFNSLAQKACELAGVLLELSGKVSKGAGTITALRTLESGAALKKFLEILKAQGPKITQSKDIPYAPYMKPIMVPRNGEISKFNLKQLLKVARTSGAPGDKLAGVHLNVDIGDKVKKGDVLFEIYAENKQKLDLAVKMALETRLVELERIILEKYE